MSCLGPKHSSKHTRRMKTISASLMIRRRTPRIGNYLFIPWIEIGNADITFTLVPSVIQLTTFPLIAWHSNVWPYSDPKIYTYCVLSRCCSWIGESRLLVNMRTSLIWHCKLWRKCNTGWVLFNHALLKLQRNGNPFFMYSSWEVTVDSNFLMDGYDSFCVFELKDIFEDFSSLRLFEMSNQFKDAKSTERQLVSWVF